MPEARRNLARVRRGRLGTVKIISIEDMHAAGGEFARAIRS